MGDALLDVCLELRATGEMLRRDVRDPTLEMGVDPGQQLVAALDVSPMRANAASSAMDHTLAVEM